ncbi:MAG: Mut7-C RNAse domain-containing protein [Candidatus Omnitrophota bacterium]
MDFAQFHFFGSLNDFLTYQKRNRLFRYFFKGNPAIKDAIEAIGVPHPEVDCIVTNGRCVGFYYHLQPQDKVRVYSRKPEPRVRPIKHLKAKLLKHPRFILDSHLGKLARHLRLLGFDVRYKNFFPDEEIVAIHQETRRIILTRDIGLLKNRVVKRGYWVRSSDPKKQIQEIIKEFKLKTKIKPFTLCLECNGRITRIPKSCVIHRLPPLTKEVYQRFFICRKCQKIYWRGAHYARLCGFVQKVKKYSIR